MKTCREYSRFLFHEAAPHVVDEDYYDEIMSGSESSEEIPEETPEDEENE